MFHSPKESKGMYTIGVHSHQASSYLISVTTVSKDDEVKEMQKVYFGETEEFEVRAHSERFFYIENWSNSSIHIKLITNDNGTNVQLKVALFKESKILPKTEA